MIECIINIERFKIFSVHRFRAALVYILVVQMMDQLLISQPATQAGS